MLAWSTVQHPSGIPWLRNTDRTDEHRIDPTSTPEFLRIYKIGEGNTLVADGWYRPVEQDKPILQQLNQQVTARFVTPMASAQGLAGAANDLPKTSQIVPIVDDGHPRVVESMMDKGPVSTLATDATIAGSLGAGPCVVVLMRAQSQSNRIYLGSIHLSSDGLRTLSTCRGNLLSLVQSVTIEMQKQQDTMKVNEAYIVGGANYEDTEFDEYARLIVAAKQLRGTFNLVGARVPVNGGNQAINAYIRANGLVEYFQQVMKSGSKSDDDATSEDDAPSDEDEA
ncbi:MAG: hypothetical protein JOZ81_04430 [Chloroflexi bacterium]|nr:hypothetical protein [Chloroflexota bacterium]